MQTDSNRLIDLDAIDESTLEPIVKLLLVVAGLFLLWGLVANLPGIEAVVPATAVTLGAVLGAAVTLGIVFALAAVAVALEPALVQAMSGPADVVDDAATIAKHVVLFVAVVVAHGGLEPLVAPTLEAVDLAWTYDLLFLVLALVPTAVIALTMLRGFDGAATHLTGRLSADDEPARGADRAGSDTTD